MGAAAPGEGSKPLPSADVSLLRKLAALLLAGWSTATEATTPGAAAATWQPSGEPMCEAAASAKLLVGGAAGDAGHGGSTSDLPAAAAGCTECWPCAEAGSIAGPPGTPSPAFGAGLCCVPSCCAMAAAKGAGRLPLPPPPAWRPPARAPTRAGWVPLPGLEEEASAARKKAAACHCSTCWAAARTMGLVRASPVAPACSALSTACSAASRSMLPPSLPSCPLHMPLLWPLVCARLRSAWLHTSSSASSLVLEGDRRCEHVPLLLRA